MIIRALEPLPLPPSVRGEHPVSQKLSDQTPQKETQPRSPITQVSLSIACLEEGRHISTMIGKLAQEKIPEGTDMLIVISDNGSRGANGIINPENDLHIERSRLYTSMQQLGHATDFDEIVAHQVTARRLELPDEKKDKGMMLQEARSNNADLATLFQNLQHSLPTNLFQELLTYQKLEDAQRQRLALALKGPHSFIEEADRRVAPRSKNQEPTPSQLATIQAYGEILLGKYDQDCNNLRIKLVTGSQTGSFGSVRKVGNKAIEEDFAEHHPNAKDTSHVVFAGFDMDSDIDPGLIEKTVEKFAQNPEGMALLGNIKLTRDYWHDFNTSLPILKKLNHRRGDHSRPLLWYGSYAGELFPILTRGFMDNTNLRVFFDQEHRNVSDFMPGGITRQHKRGKAKELPNLFPGPFIVVRGSVLKEVPMQETWGQGEDILFSMMYQRKFPVETIMSDPDISFYFNMRDPYIGHIIKGVPTSLLQGKPLGQSVREAVEPHQQRQMREQMTLPEWGEFRRNINAHMHRSTLLGATIRKIEQQQFSLAQDEYIIERRRNQNDLPQPHETTRVDKRPGLNTFTKNYDWALVAKVPVEITLGQNEYVARKLTQPEVARLTVDYESGEKVVTVHNPYTNDTESYLVRTLLEDRPFSEVPMRTAETLSTFHNRRGRRLASMQESFVTTSSTIAGE